jgi:protein TonB
MLILIDGERTVADLEQIFGAGKVEQTLAALESQGFIQQRVALPPAPLAAPVPPSAPKTTPARSAPPAAAVAAAGPATVMRPPTLHMAAPPTLAAHAALPERRGFPVATVGTLGVVVVALALAGAYLLFGRTLVPAAPTVASTTVESAPSPILRPEPPPAPAPVTPPPVRVEQRRPEATRLPAPVPPAAVDAAKANAPAPRPAPPAETKAEPRTEAKAEPPVAPPAPAAPPKDDTSAQESSKATAAESKAEPAKPAGPTALKVRNRVIPVLSKRARRAGVDRGTLTVRLHVSAEGTVARVEVINANPPQVYDSEIQRTLEQWTFEPPGAPAQTNVEFDFKP